MLSSYFVKNMSGFLKSWRGGHRFCKININPLSRPQQLSRLSLTMAFAALSTAFSFLKAMINAKQVIATGQIGDGREKALLDHVLKTAEQGNPLSVLNAMDTYAKTASWLMNFGDQKGPILDNALKKYSPKAALEIGSYCGYSAVRIASQLKRQGSKLLAFEMNADNCHIARQIINHAGLSSKVDIVNAKFDERLDVAKKFLEEMKAPFFDFVFLDHWKDRYLADYLLLKENGMLGNGSGICADNMGRFEGATDFKEYIKTHPEELESIEYKSHIEYLWWLPDSVNVITFKLPSVAPRQRQGLYF